MHRITRRVYVSAANPEGHTLAEAAAIMRAGGLVAFPTETVYGLGANALDSAAAEGIFAAKGRPAEDPLIVHIAAHHLPDVAAPLPPSVGTLVEKVLTHIWPGPLTIIVPRGAAVPPVVTAGRDTVALRMPGHPVAQALIQAADTPIAAPSANRFGHTSPTTAEHVLFDLEGRIDMVLDAGPAQVGLESTILDLTTPSLTVLRPGRWSAEALADVLGQPVSLRSHNNQTTQPGEGLIAPGMMERHYAPTAELWLCSGPAAAALAWIAEQIALMAVAGKQVGVLVSNEDSDRLASLQEGLPHSWPAIDIELLGSETSLEQIANRLYAALRALDARRPDVILARDFGEGGLALAIRDRLTRAASGRVFRVEHSD
jgi:L-threonylcarbamoyladenylate synthase